MGHRGLLCSMCVHLGTQREEVFAVLAIERAPLSVTMSGSCPTAQKEHTSQKKKKRERESGCLDGFLGPGGPQVGPPSSSTCPFCSGFVVMKVRRAWIPGLEGNDPRWHAALPGVIRLPSGSLQRAHGVPEVITSTKNHAHASQRSIALEPVCVRAFLDWSV